MIVGKRERKKLNAMELDRVTISLSSFIASFHTKVATLYIGTPENPGSEDFLQISVMSWKIGSFERFKPVLSI